MFLPSFVRSWMNGKAFAPRRARPATIRSARRRIRLQLEALEDRSVPSTVTNLFDSGGGSLRQAILDTPSGGTVDFQAGLSGKITLTTGELDIGKDLTIAGPGASALTVSGDDLSRVFDIGGTAPIAVTISGLTIADGRVGVNDVLGPLGGGIYNSGTLTVLDSTLSGNSIALNSIGVPGFGGGIYNSGTLTLRASTLSGNSADGGGGIRNDGTLTITASTLSGNSAGGGGGISNTGTLTITASTLSSNSARSLSQSGGGGGISNGGTLTITDSTLSGNSATVINNSILVLGATAFGGGIDNGGTLTVTDSTLSGNSVSASALRGTPFSYGGGISSSGTLVVTNATISGNSARSGGGGVSLSAGQLRNTIIAGNSADVGGTINSQGHNLIGDGTGGSGYTSTDLVGTSANPIDPKLGPLQNNGGPTQTMALLPGSPAIDAGDNAFSPGPFDQRGPGFPRIVNGVIDIGAFEVQAVALTVQCSVATPVLWPPDNQLVNVGLSVQVSDPSATVTVQVFANDDALPSDAADLAPGTLRLRGDRQGGGSGRVYLIVVTATDAAGDVAVAVCTVVVPHDQSADALTAVEQQAADAEAFYRAMHTAPPGYALLG